MILDLVFLPPIISIFVVFIVIFLGLVWSEKDLNVAQKIIWSLGLILVFGAPFYFYKYFKKFRSMEKAIDIGNIRTENEKELKEEMKRTENFTKP